MSRLVAPNLFEVWGAPIVVDGVQRHALRWMLAGELGLPTVPFQVWGWTKALPVRDATLSSRPLQAGTRAFTWPGGPVVALQLSIDVPAGITAVVRAMTGPAGGGQVADIETVHGPETGRAVVLSASAISSVTVSGGVSVAGQASILPVAELIDADGWQLLERVGLPVDERFAGHYALDPQGPAGTNLPPRAAAIARVAAGQPDAGWAPTTDLGLPAPPYVAPDPTALVTTELSPLLDALAKLLAVEPDPARQAETWVDVGMRAPTSVHGVAGSARWQSRSAGRVQPLGSLRFAAATDPPSALALGFGTTVSSQRGGGSVRGVVHAAASTRGPALVMVTVAHKVVIADLPLLGEVVLDGELTGFYLAQPADPVEAPAGLAAAHAGLDRPAAVDAPWLEVAEVSWNAPAAVAAQRPAPATYAVLRAGGPTGPSAPAVLLDKRPSGGFAPFAAAGPADAQAPTRVRYGDRGIPELFPGEDPRLIYSVAAQDWFGRWSGWVSTDHERSAVAPQIPAVGNVVVTPDPSGGPGAATASVDITWDWANRTPASIAVRTRVTVSGPSFTPGPGSILRVGGPIVPDHVVDFSAATPDTPPPGVEEVVERRSGDLRTYTVTVTGLVLDHDLAERIDVAMSASAVERVRPGVAGAFSPPAVATVISPEPPPPPFVPAGMVWASLPDPAGVSRVTLSWTPTGPTSVVYTADETAIARELGLASPDLTVPPADRLVALRSQNLAAARPAFRRLASAVTGGSVAVELPRGSRLIHFYAVAGVSAAGVESPFPTGSNDFLAVATPTLLRPETPLLVARPGPTGVRLEIEVAEPTVEVERVEVFRVRGRVLAGTLEAAGAPVLVLPASAGVRDGEVLRFTALDPPPLPEWQTLTYRAVAWAAADPDRGEVAGPSEPTGAVEAVVPAAGPPALTDLQVVDDGEPGLLRASVDSDAPRERTARGVHLLTVTAVGPDATVTARRAPLDEVPLVVGVLPDPDDPGDAGGPGGLDIVLHQPSGLVPARLTARVPADSLAVTFELTDPAGRRTRLTWSAP